MECALARVMRDAAGKHVLGVGGSGDADGIDTLRRERQGRSPPQICGAQRADAAAACGQTDVAARRKSETHAMRCNCAFVSPQIARTRQCHKKGKLQVWNGGGGRCRGRRGRQHTELILQKK